MLLTDTVTHCYSIHKNINLVSFHNKSYYILVSSRFLMGRVNLRGIKGILEPKQKYNTKSNNNYNA